VADEATVHYRREAHTVYTVLFEQNHIRYDPGANSSDRTRLASEYVHSRYKSQLELTPTRIHYRRANNLFRLILQCYIRSTVAFLDRRHPVANAAGASTSANK
jgi:hypothetical protein